MKNSYCLSLSVDDEYISLVDEILGVLHNVSGSGWELELEESNETIDYINLFLDILENKYEELEKIGVSRDMISIWRYYEYDEQCNMEFSSQELKRMGDNGVSFCISCWDSGESYDHDTVFEKVLN